MEKILINLLLFFLISACKTNEDNSMAITQPDDSLAVYSKYEIYISDAGNFNNPPWQILKFDGDGQNPSVFIDDSLGWPQDILFLEDKGTVLVTNLSRGDINIYDSKSGAYISKFATITGGPTRMEVGPNGLLYVLQWGGNGKVLRYNLEGEFVDEFTSIGVSKSIGLDWDESGNLYVSSYENKSVRKFDSEGQDQGLFISSNLAGPTNIWFDENNELLVSDYSGTAIKRFGPSGDYKGEFLKDLSKSEGYDFMPDGNILIGNGASSSVKMYNSDGEYIKNIIESGSGGLLTPNAVVVKEK